ncbi:MAG: patatin [Calditrichaeota bacterium]|nr:patatin [Calditrichota bacterium]
MLGEKKNITLALGGGGARGFAHIGVLRVLEQEKVPIGLIVGTSMGAIVGAVYSQLQNADAVEQKFRDLIASPVYKSSGLLYAGKKKLSEGWFDQLAEHIRERIVISIASRKQAAVGIERLYGAINFLLENDFVENTKIPFAAVATDLIEGKEVILNKGSLRDAVAASATLPGFLPPIDIYSRKLIDGAATSPVPIRAARQLAKNDKVVAVDVSQKLAQDPKLETVIDIVLRGYMITAAKYHDQLIKEADVLIQPAVGEFHWSEFAKIDWLIEEGEFAAREKLEEIIKLSKLSLFF